MKITEKGQITIPIEIREKLGFLPHTEVEFEVIGGGALRLKKKGDSRSGRGASIVSKLKKSQHRKMTTDEIMALTRE